MRLLTILFLLGAFLQVNAQSFNDITIKKDRASLETVFLEIEKQSEFRFFFNETLMKQAVPVTIDVKKVSLNKALDACFEMQPKLTYAIVEKTIIVKRKEVRETETSSAGKDFSRLAEVRGLVASERGPVGAASILVKGTNKATTTNNSGEFLLNDVDEKAVLVVSHVNHFEQEIRLNGKGLINIMMSEKVGELDEQIVVAYNKSTKKNNVGAISIVKGDQIRDLPYRSFDKALQGMVPGLLVTQGTGQPGGGLANFVLRGIATGGYAGQGATVRNPLIVVDGVPVLQDPAQLNFSGFFVYNNPMSQLNPSDIESITVLKDAAAIALYGSKASNGVILVTTKRGKAGKTIFNFRSQTDISTRLKGNADVLNQQEYLELLYETYKNTDPALWTDDAILTDLKTKFPTKSDGSFYSSPNWLDELYRKNATTFSNEISMSGGNEKQNFYVNLEYTKQNGIDKGTGFDRKSVRFNYENRPASWLKLGLNSTLSYSVQNYGTTLSEDAAARISPLNPVRDTNGEYIYNYSWGIAPSDNLSANYGLVASPAASQKLNINRNTSYRGLSKLYAELKFTDHLSFSSNFGADFMLTEAMSKTHSKLEVGLGIGPGVGFIVKGNIRNANIISTNMLRYDRQFGGKHNLNVLAGHEAQILTNNLMSVSYQNQSGNPVTEELIGTLNAAYGFSSKQTLLSYFGQVNYGYRDKYFISSSIRTDGSSLFGENRRFGSHWSVGGGWLVTAEPFMQQNADWLNYMKIRGSLGSAGNSAAIVNTLRYHRLVLTQYLNGTVGLFPDPGPGPNPNIQWEKTFAWDAGIDLKLFNDRVAVTADIYKRKTTELLGTIPLPSATGYLSHTTNIGDLENKGIELFLSADIIKTKHFRWNISANWSMNKNKLIKSSYSLETATGDNGVTSSSIIVNGEGKNYNSFYLVQWAGVDPATGMPQWTDSTGKKTSDYFAAKPQFVGKPQPDGFGSVTQTFSWKGIELSMMFHYQYGFQVYHPLLVNDGLDPYLNQGKMALDRWQKPGDVAANPRRLLFGNIAGAYDGGFYPSTRALLEGDFLRLANLSLSYHLPKRLLDRLPVSNCRIYVQGTNLALWTKYSGRQDPENVSTLGQASAVYPLQRSYSLGLNLSF